MRCMDLVVGFRDPTKTLSPLRKNRRISSLTRGGPRLRRSESCLKGVSEIGFRGSGFRV